jgi:hypothetical protein
MSLSRSTAPVEECQSGLSGPAAVLIFRSRSDIPGSEAARGYTGPHPASWHTEKEVAQLRQILEDSALGQGLTTAS